MEHAARYLSRDPKPRDVLSIYAGLRPLVKQSDVKSTAALSRDHTIIVSESGLITITGGKWTTYRKMAEDVVNRAEDAASLTKRRCETETLQLHGWTHADIPEPNLHVYGLDATELRAMMQSDPSLAERVSSRLEFQKAEVIWHVRYEMARTVEDVLARRTRALLLDAKAALKAAPAVAELMAEELGRDEKWRKRTVDDFESVARMHIFAG
jgi:glycerol-3-phosphate dehydrogenase